MDGGYYNHEFLATSIQSRIGERQKVLELGSGTGQMAKALLQANSTYDLVGIDFSPEMIEIANQRLSHSIPIIHCDVAEMNLDRKFDAAISVGGTWVIVKSENELLLGTHLYNQEKDLRGLQNVADHLDIGGLLLLSVHSPHEDREVELENGIIYSQKIGKGNGDSDHFSREKTYSFSKQATVLAKETLTLGFYKDTVFLKMLADVGFKHLGMADAEKFFILEKVA